MIRVAPIVLFFAIPVALSAQQPAQPAWKVYYDSAQLFWGQNWDRTTTLLRKSERSAFNDLGIYDDNYLTILNDLGLAYANLGDYSTARALLQQCLDLQNELGLPDTDGSALQTMANLAMVQTGQADLIGAKQTYLSVLSQASPSQHPEVYWPAVRNLAAVMDTQHETDSALWFLNNAARRGDGVIPMYEDYAIRLQIALLNRKQHRYDEAATLLSDLTSQYHQAPRSELYTLYVRVIIETGRLFKASGNFGDAERFLLQALNEVKKVAPHETGIRIETLNELGSLYQQIGIYDRAIQYYTEALNLYQSQNSKDLVAMATLTSNIAGVQLKQGNTRAAIDQYQKVLQSIEGRVAEVDPFFITVLNNLATAYRKDKQPGQAKRALERALKLVEPQSENRDLSSNVMNNMAVLLTAQGEPEKAITYYERAYDIKRSIYGENSILLADLAGNMAVVYWALRQPARAMPLFQQSVKLSLKQINYVFPNLSEAEQIQFYEKLKEDFERFASVAIQAGSTNPDLLVQVFNNQIAVKSILFLTQQQRHDAIAGRGDSALTQQYNLLRMKREQLGYAYQLPLDNVKESGLNTAALENEISALEKSISLQTSKTLAEKMAQSGTTWNAIQAKLKADEAIVEMIRYRKYDLKAIYDDDVDQVSFGFTDSVYYAALITTQQTKDHPQVVRLNEGTNLETRFLSYYRNALYFEVADNNSYQQYWKPIETAVGSRKQIFFSGDGVYHRINLNTIRRPDGKYVLETYDIHYLLNPVQYLQREETGSTSQEAVLFGDPKFYSKDPPAREDATAFQPLPGTQVEVNTINKLLQLKSWETHAYLNESATEEALKSLHSPGILHIATHGFFTDEKVHLNTHARRNFLFYSGLALAGANDVRTEKNEALQDDGILTAYEVMNLDLTNTHLVVLSACETGLGKIENGEGVYGLQRAFLQAGARNIIISLWKVDDATTQNLMVKFYQYLFEDHTEREALKLAQQDLIPTTDTPLNWGAFIILGVD